MTKNKKNPKISSDNIICTKFENLVSLMVFLFCILMVILSLISVIFPALIVSSTSAIQELRDVGIPIEQVNSFELGLLAIPLVISNIIIFLITILFYKKKLPSSITNKIYFIFNFEISKKVTLFCLVGLLAVYIGFSVSELFSEDAWLDWNRLKLRVSWWSIDQVQNQFEPHVNYFLLSTSKKLFDNYSVIPFIGSISLLLTTYFFTTSITKKRFAGIIAFVLVLQSNLFSTYDTSATYTNFWVLFYLLSLFMVYKVWPLSPTSFLLSIFSKPLTIILLPMELFFIWKSSVGKKIKLITISSLLIIVLIGLISLFSLGGGLFDNKDSLNFNSNEFWAGFTSFSAQLRFDPLLVLFIFPLSIGLFIASRHNIKHAQSMLLIIGGILFTAPLISGFTEQTNQPYRFIALVVFFAIGVGTLLSKKN